MRLMRFFRSLGRDEQGGVMVMFGFTVVLLVVAGGMALDLGKQQVTQSQLQYAADSAATSGASIPDLDNNQRKTATLRYYNLNTSGSLNGMPRPTPEINVDASTVEVKSHGNVPATFTSTVGIDKLGIASRSKVGITTLSNIKKYDFIFILDNSSSMSALDKVTGESQMAALRRVMKNLTSAILKPGLDNRIASIQYDGGLRGKVLKLTNNHDEAINHFNGLDEGGMTNSSVGSARALLMMPALRSKKKATRVVVFMSDGSNTSDFGLEKVFDKRTKNDCKVMKKDGIIVYVVAYNVYKGNEDRWMSECVTHYPSYYYYAKDAAALQSSFDSIINATYKIRIAE